MIINLLSLFNFLFGIISFLPCLMAGLMSMDSPQAQNSLLAHIIMYIMLSFPLVCWVCSILPYYFPKYDIHISFFPIVEASLFIFILWLLPQKSL
jgi:hypothetical protein